MKMHESCYYCTKRHVGCHDKCEKYKAFKENLDREKELRKEGRGAYIGKDERSVPNFKKIYGNNWRKGKR